MTLCEPSLSVIVAVGSPKKNRRLLDALQEPSIPTNIQVILVIDLARIELFEPESLKEKFGSNLTVISSNFGSPGLARNAGLDYVNSKWVCFWDCDDLPIIHNILKSINELESSRDVIIGSYLVVDQESNSVVKTSYKFSEVDYFAGVGIWRMVFRTSVIAKIKFSNLIWGEDILFFASLDISNKRLEVKEYPFYKYFVGDENQLTNSTSPEKVQSLYDLAKELSSLVVENPNRFDIRALLLKTRITLIRRARGLTIPMEMLKLTKLNLEILIKPSMSFKYLQTVFNWVRVRNRNATRIVPLGGGLGNQLFQFAAIHNFSKIENVEIDISLSRPRKDHDGKVELFNLINSEDFRIRKFSKMSSFTSKVFGYNRRWHVLPKVRISQIIYAMIIDKITILITSFYFRRKLTTYFCRDLGYEDVPVSNDNDVVFGYFQSYKWASDPQTNEYLNHLTPFTKSALFQDLLEEIILVEPIVIQIRLTDYTLDSSFGLLAPNYYKAALSKLSHDFKSNHPIWLFSDDPESAVNLLPAEIRENTFNVPNDLSSCETLELMKYASAYVIANSSFGWWGAFLRKNKDAPVLAPSPWFAGLPEPNELFPPDWVIVKSEFRRFPLE